MVAVVSSNPTGRNFFFYFLKPSMSILYRSVRYVLKTKNLNRSKDTDYVCGLKSSTDVVPLAVV